MQVPSDSQLIHQRTQGSLRGKPCFSLSVSHNTIKRYSSISNVLPSASSPHLTCDITHFGSEWRSSTEAWECVSPQVTWTLRWAAGLRGCGDRWDTGGMEVNETRPNLASTALRAARNQSETPSLFRAPRTLQSARGTAAFLDSGGREVMDVVCCLEVPF